MFALRVLKSVVKKNIKFNNYLFIIRFNLYRKHCLTVTLSEQKNRYFYKNNYLQIIFIVFKNITNHLAHNY